MKLLAALSRPCLLAVVFVGVLATACSARSEAASSPIPADWIAQSAYGVQLSVPASWSVRDFGQCPDGSRPGTLFIGTSRFVDMCPEYGLGHTQVAIYDSAIADGDNSSLPMTGSEIINGIRVDKFRTGEGSLWVVVSKHVTITGSGPNALSVMHSLAPASPDAHPAAGIVQGSAYLEALQKVPITGTIEYQRIGQQSTASALPPTNTPSPIPVFDGQYSAVLPAGRYRFSTGAGSATCTAVSVTVLSGLTVTAPTITCSGY
jgi:hypothetical protein